MNGHRMPTHPAGERGIALITVMMLLMLTSAILAAFLVTATGDTRLRAVDRTRTQAFYAAHAALEKLTSDLGDFFAGDFSPTGDDIEDVESGVPTLEGVTFTAADGLGYNITFTEDVNGDPQAQSGTIAAGPFQGFIGLLTPYTLTVTSRTATGAEARLQRTMQTVSIPVFQFGVFSETDLTFSANGTFSFGGRVHTNGNLFAAAAGSGVLYLRDKVTAFGEVIRTHLANSRSIGSTHDGTVMVNRSTATCTGTSTTSACRRLDDDEGSLTGNVGSSQNPQWMNLFGTYNGYLRNNRNGITALTLPLVSEEVGGTPIDMIRRPIPGEEPLLTSQRLFDQAGIRILLSDDPDDITGLQTVSAAAPRSLATPDGYAVALNPTFLPPWALSPGHTGLGVCTDGNCAPVGTPLVGGFLKVEYRNAADVWTDVTDEWLGLGFTRPNFDAPTQLDSSATVCAEPNPNAILRLQRVKQNPSAGVTSTEICETTTTPAVPVATDYWPLTLYDIREAFNRDGTASDNLHMAGVMHYVDLDVNNLRLWLAGTIGASGAQVVNEDGFTVYFSDRRGNRNTGGAETGEFGFEDIVNNGGSAGTLDNTLGDGEDMNSNGVLDVYGATPRGRNPANQLTTDFTGWVSPFNGTADPYTNMGNANSGAAPTINNANRNNPQYRARSNPPLFFRRALKLTNGGLGNLPADGLTVVAENPVYVQGHYNGGTASWGNGAPAAIMADSITVLSAAWDTVALKDGFWYGHGDTRSFYIPNTPADREAANTWYRFAALSGKTRNWVQAWQAGSFGTDGGVHNFLRLLEDWNSSKTLNYRGAIASFFYSRQATGLFRCCNDVYTLPATRNLSFDTNFLNPQLLPPKTPMFRDINTTGFVQVTRRQ